MDVVQNLFRLARAHITFQIAIVLAGLADVGQDGELHLCVNVIARQHGTKVDPLERVLRFAMSEGLVQAVVPGTYRLRKQVIGSDVAGELLDWLDGSLKLTSLSEAAKCFAASIGIVLRTSTNLQPLPELEALLDPNTKGSMRAWLTNFQQVSRRLFAPNCLRSALQTGRPQWTTAFGEEVQGVFDLGQRAAGVFESVMTAMHQSNVPEAELLSRGVLPSPLRTVLDIGGASGALGTAYCRRYPEIDRYVIYELAGAIPLYQRLGEKFEGTNDRIEYRRGDFLREPTLPLLSGLSPDEKFDLINIAWILHDWTDETCRSILRKARAHLVHGGQMLLFEAVLPSDRLGPATFLDVTMLVQTGGRERTEQEFRSLLESSGLRLVANVSTGARRNILQVEAKS